MKPFAEINEDLESDGSLRDFYIVDVTAQDWDRFIGLAQTLGERVFFRWGGKEVALPARFSEIQAMQQVDPTTLTIVVANAWVNCHFFAESELELDFRPNDFLEEGKWRDLYALFQSIADALGKKGIITHEDTQQYVIDEVLPRKAAEPRDQAEHQ